MSEISPLPQIPPKIKEAINQKKLVIFLGAGASRLLGCKSWEQLGYELLDLCFKKEFINFKEKESLSKIKDNKKLISICYYLLEEKQKTGLFNEILGKALEGKSESLQKQNIYAELKDFRAIFVTTNADKYLSEQFREKQVKYEPPDFLPNEIDTENIYHIHGSQKKMEKIIFTVDKYIERYNDKQFSEFIKKIFSEYTVLFIGYGLSEFELFDYIIQKAKVNGGKEIKHFVLMGFFAGEDNLVDYEQYYFNQLGIKVIPFSKDKNGYEQQFQIIQSWNKEIKQTSTVLSSTFDEITEAIKNG
jgi:glycosyltransferase involved in cell wall biosynthesis